MINGTPIREESAADYRHMFSRVESVNEPVIYRGLVEHWPLIRAANQSMTAAIDYLNQFDAGHPVTVFSADKKTSGRIFYTDELEQVNFQQSKSPISDVFEQLSNFAGQTSPPTLYMGSTSMKHFFPGLVDENSLPSEGIPATVRVWIGNQTTVGAHYDALENIACVCAGHREFTLFPPEQIANLYVGPIDFTPAGQAVSLVDFDHPDLDRFPRFSAAIEHARTAVLEPGDAIYIPALWWHHVKGLDAFNVLINHWWKAAPDHVGPPLDALLHALLNIRDLPLEQRKAWQVFFNHYVFEGAEAAAEHIPVKRRGALGDIDENLSRRIRATLRNNLNR